MKRILIYQEGIEPISLDDDDDTAIDKYTENLSQLLTSEINFMNFFSLAVKALFRYFDNTRRKYCFFQLSRGIGI